MLKEQIVSISKKSKVFKSGEKDGISGLVKGLQGAEFTFRLKSEVDHVAGIMLLYTP